MAYLGSNDFTLTVAGDGTATSSLQFADRMDDFATLCDVDAIYTVEFVDNDGFGIALFQVNTGPVAFPINKKVKNFRAKITGGTPGKVIVFRVGGH